LTVDPVADQADAVVGVLASALESGVLLGAYLYGSAVDGGLRPDSDLDLFGVLARRLTPGERRALLDGLLPISGRSTRPPEWRPVELTLVAAEDVVPWRYPPRLDFQYGEWLREEAIAGTLEAPSARPDVAILLTLVRERGRSLVGPAPQTLLDPVPPVDLVRAVQDELQPVLGDIRTDTRNVLLTLARMWCTVETAQIRSKDGAATWALARLHEAHRPLLECARAAYLGEVDDPGYDQSSAESLAEVMAAEIRALR
jgi:predicted nucleotidyltransferase